MRRIYIRTTSPYGHAPGCGWLLFWILVGPPLFALVWKYWSLN